MAIMLQGPDYSALSQAFGNLGQSLQKRGQSDILSQALQQTDPEQIQNILGKAIQMGVPGEEVKKIAETVGKIGPSKLDKILQQYTSGPNKQQMEPGAIDPTAANSLTHPANNAVPFGEVPDEALAVMASSPDKELQNFGKQNLELRDRNYKRYNEERKYETSQAKSFTDEMHDLRTSLPNRESSINNMKYGIENRDPATETKDWFASNFGRWGSKFISPEGQLLESSVKNFLVDDLSSIPGGRPNMFLEQRIVSSLAGLGKSRLANEAVVTALDSRHKRDKAKLDAYDRLSQHYKSTLGYVPGDIDRIVSESIAPIYKEIQNQESYKLRQIQERDKGVSELAGKKVIPGTPLTREMMNYLSAKYGVDTAKERVKKLGYTIPSRDEYERYSL